MIQNTTRSTFALGIVAFILAIAVVVSFIVRGAPDWR